MEFDWDSPKATANARKHGVAFDEVATVFWMNLRCPVRIEITAWVRPDTSRLAHRVWVSCSRSRTHTAQLRYASSVHGG